MKTKSFSLAAALGLAFALCPARADDPAPTNLTPELQAMLADLLKGAARTEPEPAKEAEPAPAVVPAPAARPVRPPLGSASSLRTGSLTTPTLTGGRLDPSPALGGRGLAGNQPRLSDSEWRLLFPARP